MKGKRKIVISLAAVIMLFLLVSVNVFADTYITYYKVGFGSTESQLSLTGDAALSGGKLYLTPASGDKAGAAFFTKKIKQSEGFSTYFKFYLSNQSSSTDGADGIVFIIAADSNGLGDEGEGIGYSGIDDSVGIEFDTYKNTNDISASHIGIDLNGSLTSDSNSSNRYDLGSTYFHTNTSDPFYAWVDYDGTTLDVYVSRTNTRPASPQLSKVINLATYCGDEYYVGFTAATGGSYENHIIEKWYFKNSYVEEGLEDGGSYATDPNAPTAPTMSLSGTTVSLSGSTDSDSGIDHYEYKVGSGVWTAGSTTTGVSVDIASQSLPVTIYGRAVDKVGNISSETSATYGTPTVTASAATGVTKTDAVMNGSISADGGSSITEKGFRYSSSASTLAALKNDTGVTAVTASGTSTGSYSSSLSDLSPGTTYYYISYAKNSLGTAYGSTVYSFTTLAPPAVSTNSAGSIAYNQATLSGTVSSAGSTVVSGYGFYYSKDYTDADSIVSYGSSLTYTGSVTNFSGTPNLTPGTTYYYVAYAENSVGRSYGGVKSFTTPIAAPASLTATVSTSNLSLDWGDVEGAVKYQVYVDGTKVGEPDVSELANAKTGLSPNTNHSYYVIAVGSNASSNQTSGSVWTQAEQPAITSADPMQNGSVVLTVDKKSNSANTKYYIEKSQNSGFSGTTTVMSYGTLSGTTVTVQKSASDENTGALPGKTYYFRMKAENNESVPVETAYSASASCLTVPEIPGAPTLTAAEVNGTGAKKISISWTAVQGAASYDVYNVAGANHTCLGNTAATSYTDSRSLSAGGGLVPNTSYTYVIVSRNAGTAGSYGDGNGCSLYSSTSNRFTAAAAPDVDSVTALANGNISLKVNERDNPGATEYLVEVSPNTGFNSVTQTAWTDPSGDHLITVSGLDRGTTYYFRVKARNSEGVITEYGTMTGSVKTIPADITGSLTVTAASSSQLNFSWASAAGATSYDIYYSADGSDYTFLKNVNGISSSETGLSPNAGRFYKVYAKSTSGVSQNALANSSAAYTYAAVPGIALDSQGDGSVTVTIDSKNNSSATGYNVEYGTDSSLASGTSASGYDTSTSRTITGLNSDTVYYFRVKARNGNGVETSYSQIVNTATVLSVPVIQTVQAQVSGTAHSVVLAWNPSTATSYSVYRDGALIGRTSGTTYTDSGLKANKLYTYTLAAVNGGGESGASPSKSIRTLAEYPSDARASDKTKTSFTIDLTPSSNLASSEEYQLTIKKSGDGTVVRSLSWSTDTSYEVQDLSDDTSYDVFINVRNSDGVERGSEKLLTLFCNRDISGAITNDADVISSEAGGHNGGFKIRLKVWDPDGDLATVSAVIEGIRRTAKIEAPVSEPADYNVELAWDAYTLQENSYSNIPVTVSDGNDSTVNLTYTHTLKVDKTAPVVTVSGDKMIYLETGDAYSDDGASVAGDDGNGLNVSGLPIDTSTAGTYRITYTATDDAGNTTAVTRTVTVADPVSSETVTLDIPEDGVGNSSAVLNGGVTTLGKLQHLSDHGFIWSVNSIPDDEDIDGGNATKISLGAKDDMDSFTSPLTGLNEASDYYVRPYVVYDGRVYLGNEEHFTTHDDATDTNRIFLWPTCVSRAEDDTDVTMTIYRIGDDTTALTIPVGFGGTADIGDDYTVSGLNGEDEVTIEDGESYATFTVSINGDSDYEADETILISIESAGAYIAVGDNSRASVTIKNDDEWTPGSGNYISRFVLAGVNADIDSSGGGEGTIKLTVPYGTDLTGIAPSVFEVPGGATISPSIDTVRDFTGDVAYTITAEDGSSRRYVVTVTVAGQSQDSTLSDLTIKDENSDDIPLSPGFTSDTTEYTANVSSDCETVDLSALTGADSARTVIKVNGKTADDPSKLELDYGDNTVTVTVTAENGEFRAYTVIVTRAAGEVNSNANLSGIGISDGTLSPSFDKDTASYSVNVANGVDTMDITPALSDKDASFTITVNGTATSGKDVELNTGANVFVITVTSTDGTKKTYVVNITRAENSVNTLSNVEITDSSGNGLPLSPSFSYDTTEYTADVDFRTGSIRLGAAVNDPAATYKLRVNGVLDNTPDSVDLAYGENIITVEVTAANGSVKTYTFIVTRAHPGSNANLVSVTLKNGTLEPAFNSNLTNYNVNLDNSVTTETVTVTLSDPEAVYIMKANGAVISSGSEVPLNVGANVFSVTVTAQDGTIKTYSISVSRAKASSGGGGGGGGAVSNASSSVPVIVNNQTISAGTQTTGMTADGRQSTTVKVDTAMVEAQLKTAGNNANVTVPISGDQGIKSGILTGDMINKMEEEGATLRVDTGNVQYVILANEINIGKVAEALGGATLSDINVIVNIDNLSGSEAAFVSDTAGEKGFTLVVQPVAFTVAAEHDGKTVEIDSFDNYIKRLIAIPDYVDRNKITTAVVIGKDGETHHVPTEVSLIDGKYYAVINSLTNSTYALIWNPVSFSDMNGHWAEEAVNDMGARTVVNGVGSNMYSPDRSITRCEFAAVVVRALGLDVGQGSGSFTDVSSSAWYNGYIKTAAGYGIINGYGNGTFGPNDTITREQAMAMVARAMKITGIEPKFTEDQINKLLSRYSDSSVISDYAREGIASCIETEVVLGRPDGTVASKSSITRAEVAAVIERLLKKSELI